MYIHPHVKSSLLALLATLGVGIRPAFADNIAFTAEAPVGTQLKLPVCSWSDSNQPTRAIIVAIHGATLYSRTFDETARHLAARGYPVYASDMRGFGRWRTESSTFNGDDGIHYSQTKEDLLLILSNLRQEFPGKKIYCLGESVGANLCFWLASNKPELLDGVIVSSPCIKKIFHPNARMAVDVPKCFFNPNAKCSMGPYIEPFLSENKKLTQAYMNDAEIMHGLSAAELIKSMRTNTQALAEVKYIPVGLPILIIAGEKDAIYSSKAVPSLAKEIGSDHKTVFIEPNRGHLLLETKFVAPEILGQIDEWLAKNETATDKISKAE
jgi:alpha-beta hydrolase superfamily lysophospholipase